MRAVQFDRFGPPEVLSLVERPTPAPGPGMVRVRVRASALNPADYKWRSGSLQEIAAVELPHVLGYDVAGVVDALGDGVTAPPVGARVVGMLDHREKGGYAEYALLPAAQATPIPDGLDFATASALPTAGLTAVQAVEEGVRPEPGQSVLVTGALGGVGRFALRALADLGARPVAAVREGELEAARKAGASEAIVLGRPWPGGPLHHVLDTLGGPEVAALCRHVEPGGRIIHVGTTPIPDEDLPIKPVFFVVHHDPRRLARLVEDAASGRLVPPVARQLPLEDAAEAHRLLERGGAGGKIVLTL